MSSRWFSFYVLFIVLYSPWRCNILLHFKFLMKCTIFYYVTPCSWIELLLAIYLLALLLDHEVWGRSCRGILLFASATNVTFDYRPTEDKNGNTDSWGSVTRQVFRIICERSHIGWNKQPWAVFHYQKQSIGWWKTFPRVLNKGRGCQSEGWIVRVGFR